MQKHFYRLLLFFTFCIFVYSDVQSQFSGVKWEQFSDYFLGRDLTFFSRAVVDKHNAVFLVGETYSRGGGNPFNVVVRKVGANGTAEWEKVFENYDIYTGFPKAIVEASLSPDNSLIVLLRSQSFDIAGHHGVDTNPDFSGDGESGRDVMVMKISQSGEMVWQKFIGGKRMDHATGLAVDSDGNIFIAGTTYSVDGDFLNKRRVFDSIAHYGDSSRLPDVYYNTNDAFIAKLSTTGELLKLKCYGGSRSDVFSTIIFNGENGFFTGGSTASTDFDVKANNVGIANWFLKIDSALNITEEYCIGSTKGFSFYPETHLLKQKMNGKLLFSNGLVHYEIDTSTKSWAGPINFGLSPENHFDSEGNLYKIDVQHTSKIIKYDNDFNIIWEKKIPVSGFSQFKVVAGNGISDLYFLGSSDLPFVYDPYHKYVGIAVKYNAAHNIITGKVFADFNSNNQYDTGDKLVSGIKIEANQNGLITSVLTGPQGSYNLSVDTGNYIVRAAFDNQYYSLTPVSKSVYFSYINESDTIDFTLQPILNKKDLSINLLPLNIARPGFPVQYQLICTNKGTETISNVQVKFLRNPRVSFISSTPAVSSTVADTMIWNIASLKPFDTAYIHLNMKIAAPPTVNNTDTLLFKSFAFPFAGDETRDDNQSFLTQQVQGSYDPNDKTETHGGIITPEQLAGNDYLTYLIRFQNTGTDTAFNVMIRDTLQNKLDWNSFEMINASHPYYLYMVRPDVLEWSFPNILLVDSNRNEPASHGFVAYRIKPKSTLAVGDTVLNRAHIFFDYNLPVITNDEKTVLRNSLVTSITEVTNRTGNLLLYPNPSKKLVTVTRKGKLNGVVELRITDINGRMVYAANYGKIVANEFTRQIDILGLPAGFYVLNLRAGKELYSSKLIIK